MKRLLLAGGGHAHVEVLRDLAEHMAEWDEALPLERRLMHVAATMACHGSVRAGRRLSSEAAREIRARRPEAEILFIGSRHGLETQEALSGLIAIAHDVSELRQRTGRSEPTVVT